MNIALDMMGGDFAPLEAVKGVFTYLSETSNPAQLLLIGDKSQIEKHLENGAELPSACKIIHASQHIEMEEHPTKALKEKQHSSIALGFQLLASGEADAFISAGNTGAMLVGALLSIKPIEGITRPTIGTYLPREDGNLGLLLDAGINADCKPENLCQFALLGSLFAKHVWNIQIPKVGLLNIGEEEGKGNILAQATYPLLKENKQINFVGNVEGRDIFSDKADIIVCEGFTGNVILKMAEGIHDIIKRRNINDPYFERFEFGQYGGVPVLGVNKPVIVGHGISREDSFKNMIGLAEKIIESDLPGKIRNSFRQENADD
ncbi:MAG: phosphate acyltransferase PlsX [Chitinophagaceae bacterium]|nr:phosphate acyltransferase PlsX [Chitinophagaceae bacterium]